MSPSQSQTRTRRSRRPPRPTTARGPRAGLAISLVLHAGLLAGTYLTWHRMMDMSEESHAVPVDLITIAQTTNVAPQAPPPDKIEIPTPAIEPPRIFADKIQHWERTRVKSTLFVATAGP